ncbi:MAG TPA: ATP-binding protein [Pirellulales bacterium]|nr:ATP-binding protein [Pirellulales bacterium]
MTFRQRIIVALIPLLILLAVIGGTATILIYRIGTRIEEILHENYDSVIYMRNLNEALERIDSSFQFALAGREDDAFKQYQANLTPYDANLKGEQGNITLPGEAELVESLTMFSKQYREQGDAFYKQAKESRTSLYFSPEGQPGLYDSFRKIKEVSSKILKMNEDNMHDADQQARRMAHLSLWWYGVGLVLGVALAAVLLGSTIRTILYPIRALTDSATAIGHGDLDQLVSVSSDDEIGALASAFNTMARQLRDLLQSQRGQLVLAQQTGQATINSFPDPVLVINRQHEVEMANPVARRLLGVVPVSETGSASTKWEPPAALRQPLADSFREQGEYLPQDFDKAINLRTGDESRSFLPRIAPIRDAHGMTRGVAVLLQDITRFRLLDEVKSNLVATVSHELKTPLTSIRLALHLLLEDTTGPLLPKQLELLIDARDNAERILVMINNLLDLARLEQAPGQLHFQPSRPGALMRSMAESFRPRAAEQGVELSLEAPADLPQVAVDVDQLQHALQNLLDNALAYTPLGGRIKLAAKQVDGKIAFSVTDTGRGIPSEYIQSVFEKYFRIPGSSVPGGSGLGLAIVREIATAHGGSVECESEPGKKTVFRMFLPILQTTDSAGARA